MVKVFTPNKDGKIEFTKDELEKLLNEVWYDGRNSATYTWTSPYLSTITTPYYATGTTTATITGTNTNGVTVEYSSENDRKL